MESADNKPPSENLVEIIPSQKNRPLDHIFDYQEDQEKFPVKKPKLKSERKHRFSFKKFLKIFLWTVLGVVLLTVLSVVGIFAYYKPQLPNPDQLVNRQINQTTHILDRNGNNLYDIHGEENRTLVTGSQISPYIKQAEVATEDANFYHEYGFSPTGIIRAILVRIPILNRFLPAGELAGGGSTITQQYVKNALLSDSETISRKIKELILSIEVEQIYTKDQILTGYLNEIPYGSGAYGIEAAARTYFNVDAKDLTLSESAILAAIPQAPTYYSPYGNHLDDLFARKDYILDRMVATGYITKAQADAAKVAAPSPNNLNFREQANLVAPHFDFYIREQMINILDPSDPQKAEQMLDDNGYTITTSLDLPTQKMAESIISTMGPEMVKKYNASNAALVAIDPKTGQIIAMVGSIDYYNSYSGETNFATALLQPGSSFKPIMYATAFNQQHGLAPGTIVQDTPADFGGYKPMDYDLQFRGNLTIRQALAESLNIPAVRTINQIGIPDTISTAKKLGIDTINQPADHYGLTLALGSAEVPPVEMANAYATFADQGVYHPLTPILTVTQNGKTIYDFTKTHTGNQAITPEVAYEITNILADLNAKKPTFGSTVAYLSLAGNRPAAVKTGTSENFRDGWTIGYTPSIATAVWVGNNKPNQTMHNASDGVMVAAPIWQKFMNTYLSGSKVEQFPIPSDITTTTIDTVSGKIATDLTPAQDKITDIFAPWQLPQGTDNIHVQSTLDFVVPTADQYVNGPTVISLNPGGPRPVTQVQVYVNDNLVGTLTQAPWTVNFDFSTLPNGPATIKAIATNDQNITTTTQINVNIGLAPTPSPSPTPTPSPSSSPTSTSTPTPTPNPNPSPTPINVQAP
jgi:membrane peptidoglycan carboxypeptidase